MTTTQTIDRSARKGTRHKAGSRGPGPNRRCIATGDVGPAAAMVRLVLAPDGTVVPDLAGRLPGRGFWLSARRDAVKTACDKNLFARAARARATVPDGLDGQIERQLTRRCQDLLGFARRAGGAVCGFEKAAARLRSGRAGLVLEAADGAAGGRAKITAMAGEVPVAGLLTAAELGAALGRDSAVHVVVDAGPIADKLGREIERLRGFRPDDPLDRRPEQETRPESVN
ncbi:MAG: RNA-binding protein [Rhodospirillales bacterium]|nr:RNA-binding protein [Rhodospirillales bacterium]